MTAELQTEKTNQKKTCKTQCEKDEEKPDAKMQEKIFSVFLQQMAVDLQNRLYQSGGWVNAETDLPDYQALEHILVCCEQALRPAPQKQYEDLAIWFVDSYPHTGQKEMGVYLQAIVSVLSQLPLFLATKLVDQITLETKFLPSRAELYQKAKSMVARPAFLQNTAQRMMQEHARRRKEYEQSLEEKKPKQKKTTHDKKTSSCDADRHNT